MILAVTGTNTDVGKTIVSAALARAAQAHFAQVRYCKPVQTGEPARNGDVRAVAHNSDVAVHEFACYPEPLAPNLSARRAGIDQLQLEDTVAKIQALDGPDTLVILEGAGGLLVRLADDFSFRDLVVALQAPLVVVTSLQLGSLNSAELTVRAATGAGISVLATIGGLYPESHGDAMADLAVALNEQELPVVTEVPYLGSLPAGMGSASEETWEQAVAQLELAPLWKQLGV